MLAIATFVGIAGLADHVATHALLAGVSGRTWPRWPAWVDNWIRSLAVGALILVILLFPDGKPLSRRWRWVVSVTVVDSVWFAAATAVDSNPVRLSPHLPSLENPVVGARALAFFTNSAAFFVIPFLLIMVVLILALTALILRLRRSRGEERQQLKWFAYATGVSVCALVVAFPLAFVNQGLSNAVAAGAFTVGFAFAVPGAAALAILRYRLYEIDIVINKTIVYFSLAAVITAIYVGIVVGIGAAIGSKGTASWPSRSSRSGRGASGSPTGWCTASARRRMRFSRSSAKGWPRRTRSKTFWRVRRASWSRRQGPSGPMSGSAWAGSSRRRGRGRPAPRWS